MAFETFNLAQIYGAADRANAQREAQQYQQYQIQRQMRDDQRQDAVRGAYKIGPDGQLDRQGTYAGLYQVDPIAALDLQGKLSAQDAAAAKAGLDRTKEELDIAAKRAQVGRDLIASSTPESWPAIVQQGRQMGMGWANNAPAEYNQDWVRQNVTTADQFISQNTPKYERIDLGGKIQVVDVNPITNPSIKGTSLDKTLTPDAVLTDQRTRSENALNRGVTIRGQNMTDARAREANSTVKPPSGYRLKSDGTLEAIPGGPGDRKLNPTEGQGKAALYATRAAEADSILNDLGNNYSRLGVAAKNSGITEYIPGATTAINALSSDNTQKADQAQRNFINAILRQESGAAISASEFDNARKQYFPQPGDSDALVRQKAENRASAINGLNNMSGPLATDRQQVIPKNERMPAPKVGTVVDGYVFNGGNPADPKSWKKK